MTAGKAASVEPGDVVAGKYRVERVIGRGAMGLVLAAVDVQLGKGVALKCLLPHAWGNAAAVARFEREARAAGVLESEHVCRVLDVGRMPDGAPFIAMELLEGMDLAHELHSRGGRIPIPAAVSHVIEACDAISEAHARGIIHRDLKPSILFLAKRAHREPIIKVLDFGISKPTAAEQSPSALTGTADLLGSPLYMSPEQLRTPKGVDARADQWSLAATLYELLCGKAPFDGRTIADLAANIMNQAAPDIRRTLPNAPAGLAEAILRALAKSPDGRFATVADFARALAPYGQSKTTAPMAIVTPAAPPPPPISSTKMLTTPLTPREANRTLPLAPSSTPASAPALPVAPSSDPSLVRPTFADTAAPPPPVHSLSGPLGLFGMLVMAITVVVVVVVMRAKDDPSTPAPDASASAPASSSIASSEPPVPVTSGSVTLTDEHDAAVLPALSASTVPVVVPTVSAPPRPSNTVRFPDANDPGY